MEILCGETRSPIALSLQRVLCVYITIYTWKVKMIGNHV